ncbi:inactive sodium-dependent neutral amino acid transporter B(0)AT3-like [Clytia hemisphaerica]|uniref:Transporter n=1 Tax=Clytia hemisphaerica TaxID=252671 RepID=A0A7M5UBX3_9CNID
MTLFGCCRGDPDENLPLTQQNQKKTSNQNVGTINDDETKETWGNKAEFLLASIGLAVGLGNIWRFPYLCQKNGGGAFLIPYLLMMIMEGFPLFIIEYAIGQRFKQSAVGCWGKIHPALRGIGIGSIVLSGFLCIYYVAVIAWSFFYLFVSMRKVLPWERNNCPSSLQLLNNSVTNETCCTRDPEAYYFYVTALNAASSIESTDGKGMSWQLILCLLLSWVLVYACVVKGVKSSGKAVYFTATFPYLILIILLIAGALLTGADIGLVAFFKPDFSRLLDPKIWLDAAGQMFFTLSIGFGALLAFASYMPTKNNCMKDAYTVVSINCFTSILAGIVVFSILGHREQETGQSAIESGSGPGLVFITFANAFLQMDGAPFWAVCFFVMLILLGIDSEFGTFEAFVYPFYDMKWITMNKSLFSALVAIGMFLIGLCFVSPVGYYVFQIFDDYSLSFGLLTVGFFQTISVSWVYGNDKFANDIEYMTGRRPLKLWLICWKYISPIVIMIIIISNIYLLSIGEMTYKAYGGCFAGFAEPVIEKEYPAWAKFVIIVLICLPIAPILIGLIKDLVQNPQEWKDGFQNRLCHPIEYAFDPSDYDLNRRYHIEDLTMTEKDQNNAASAEEEHEIKV